jgi:hypothetical protein
VAMSQFEATRAGTTRASTLRDDGAMRRPLVMLGVVVALGVAPPVHADPGSPNPNLDASFLDALTKAGITINSGPGAVKAGKTACGLMAQGRPGHDQSGTVHRDCGQRLLPAVPAASRRQRRHPIPAPVDTGCEYRPVAATLHLLTRGRAILGIGTGEREGNEPYGVDWSKPVDAVRRGHGHHPR